jgi:outer membrane protein assembly factor BamB
MPAVSGQTLVFAQADGTITALSPANGGLLWQHSPRTGAAADMVMDGVAIGGGRVFFAQSDGRLQALSASNGEVLWTYQSRAGLRSAPLFSDGFVFLGEFGGIFSALDPQTGERVWGGGAGGAINTPTAHGGYVFFSSWAGSVHSVRINGVIPQWNTNVGAPVTTPPFVDGGRIFVGTADGHIVALSRENGEILWSFHTAEGNVTGTPIAADGLVFAGGGMGTLFALDAASGTVRSTFSAEGGINGTPAYSAGILFLGSSGARIYAIR